MYIQTKSLSNIFIVIIASLILALAFILSNIYSELKEIKDAQEKINQKFIRDKELENMRLDLREIKKEVFKKK